MNSKVTDDGVWNKILQDRIASRLWHGYCSLFLVMFTQNKRWRGKKREESCEGGNVYLGEDRSENLVKAEDTTDRATVHRVTLINKNTNTM